MRRVLVDYKKLDRDVAALLIESYPDGYGDDDIIAFKNAKGELIEAVELRTADTLYMVKISQSLSHFIANFEDTMEKELENKSNDTVANFKEHPDANEAALELELDRELGADEESEIE